MAIDNPEIDIETDSEVDEAVKSLLNYNLVLYNDDVNSFQHVIACLTHVCNHNPLQAEQCALIVHHNGKCSVKEGSYETLKPMCEQLLHYSLSAKIE